RGGSLMQIPERYPQSVAAPRHYRNRPHSAGLNASGPAPQHDVIYLIDADPVIREEISTCFAGLPVTIVQFSTATEYLNFHSSDSAACVILDTHLPDVSGFDLQASLSSKEHPPIIFVSDHADIPSIVRAMKAGALEFLTTPLDMHALVTAVEAAF